LRKYNGSNKLKKGLIMIIDTHLHVISTDEKKYPLRIAPDKGLIAHSMSSAWFREVPLTVERLLQEMGDAGVDRVVLVQPMLAYTHDNSYAADSAKRYPGRFVSVGIIDMLADGAADRLEYWIKERGMMGLRIISGGKDRGMWLDDPLTFPVWERAASLHIPICIQAYPVHLSKIGNLLERFPAVTVTLDHLAHANADDELNNEELAAFQRLVKFPNLYLKFSTLNIDTPAATRFFRFVLERFGPNRMMWGSNYPANHAQSYKEQVEIARRTIAGLGAAAGEQLLSKTALSIWPSLSGFKD
jgi:L-fuconolactonase